jgi:quercetin dioxygenase-like cupin family protein
VAHAGQVIEDPVIGARVTFLQTAQDTDGELLQFEEALAPGGFVQPHVHVKQEERLRMLDGSLRIKVARKTRAATAGDEVVIPAAVGHSLRNVSQKEARVLVELRPALATEALLERFWRLAREGKTNRWGVPAARELALMMSEHKEDFFYLPWVPPPLQRLALAALLPVAKRRRGRASEGP